MSQDSRFTLDIRSVIVAVVVLFVGAAIGFGVGYRYEKHTAAKTASAAKAKTTSPTTAKASSSKSAEVAAKSKLVLIACMAKNGVKYPSGATDVSKPPPGVAETPYKTALTACARDLVGAKKG